jgi:hypothetical protein
VTLEICKPEIRKRYGSVCVLCVRVILIYIPIERPAPRAVREP